MKEGEIMSTDIKSTKTADIPIYPKCEKALRNLKQKDLILTSGKEIQILMCSN